MEKGQTGQSLQKGDSNANNHLLQHRYVEEHLTTRKTSTWTAAEEQ